MGLVGLFYDVLSEYLIHLFSWKDYGGCKSFHPLHRGVWLWIAGCWWEGCEMARFSSEPDHDL